MFAIYGMRILSLSTSVRLLRVCPFLTQKFPSRKEFNNFYSTSWPSSRITKPTGKTDSLYLIKPPDYYSTKSSRPSRDDIQLNKKIMSLKTVDELLQLFESEKKSASIVNRVTLLFSMAKIIERVGNHSLVLEEQQNSQHSIYMDLLESISKVITKCQPRALANVIWALGKLQEKDHKLVQVCEKEILSRDIVVFNNANICQIVNGCANLSMTTSEIFTKLQEAILNGQVRMRDFEDRGLSGILLSFATTDNGSVELFDAFLEEILSRDSSMIDSRGLAEFVWSFAKKELKADKLFDRIEQEILRRGTTDLSKTDVIKILWAFGKAGKGSKQLYSSVDNELISRGVDRLHNAGLLEIVWSFSTRNMTKAKVFDLVKQEVFNRAVCMFQAHELVLILFSFVSAQRHDDKLVTEIEGELYLMDVKQFSNGHLCQVAWSLGRSGKSDSQLFDVIEAEVFQRGACEFSKEQKSMLMRGFIEAKRGSKEFYELLCSSFSTNELSYLSERDIYEFAWCFSEADVEAGALFDALEKEILNKEKYNFSKKQLTSIKKSFQKVGKGTKDLFEL